MARKTKPHEPDPFEQQLHEEMTRTLNTQFKGTIERIQRDYAGTGRRMAEAACSALDDQEFADFLFDFFASATMRTPRSNHDSDETNGFSHVMSTAIFVNKWSHGQAVNVPGHIEDLLVGDRYLRRFFREFYRDIIAQKNANSDKQDS